MIEITYTAKKFEFKNSLIEFFKFKILWKWNFWGEKKNQKNQQIHNIYRKNK